MTLLELVTLSVNQANVVPTSEVKQSARRSTLATNALFVESLGGLTYILPNYSLWTYYVTDIFGWVFEIFSIYLVVKIIGYVDEKRTKSGDACYYYALAYVETLLGQAIFVNNTFLLWHAFTNLPFWLMVFAFVNNFGNKIKLSKLR